MISGFSAEYRYCANNNLKKNVYRHVVRHLFDEENSVYCRKDYTRRGTGVIVSPVRSFLTEPVEKTVQCTFCTSLLRVSGRLSKAWRDWNKNVFCIGHFCSFRRRDFGLGRKLWRKCNSFLLMIIKMELDFDICMCWDEVPIDQKQSMSMIEETIFNWLQEELYLRQLSTLKNNSAQ